MTKQQQPLAATDLHCTAPQWVEPHKLPVCQRNTRRRGEGGQREGKQVENSSRGREVWKSIAAMTSLHFQTVPFPALPRATVQRWHWKCLCTRGYSYACVCEKQRGEGSTITASAGCSSHSVFPPSSVLRPPLVLLPSESVDQFLIFSAPIFSLSVFLQLFLHYSWLFDLQINPHTLPASSHPSPSVSVPSAPASSASSSSLWIFTPTTNLICTCVYLTYLCVHTEVFPGYNQVLEHLDDVIGQVWWHHWVYGDTLGLCRVWAVQFLNFEFQIFGIKLQYWVNRYSWEIPH